MDHWMCGAPCQGSHQPQPRRHTCFHDTFSNQGPYKVSVITTIETSSVLSVGIGKKFEIWLPALWTPLIQYCVYRYYTQRKLKCRNKELWSLVKAKGEHEVWKKTISNSRFASSAVGRTTKSKHMLYIFFLLTALWEAAFLVGVGSYSLHSVLILIIEWW